MRGSVRGMPGDRHSYRDCATRADFDRKLGKFMARHGKRGALVRRLVEAGLWQKSSQ